MKKCLLVLACLLLLVPFADAQIAKENRIENYDGYCAWASLETLARHLGLEKLYGLVNDKRLLQAKSGATLEDVDEELKSRHVDYTLNPVGQANLKFIQDAVDEDGGCVIGVVDWPCKGSCHAIVPFYYKGKKILFHDPNEVRWWYDCTVEWIEQHWIGWGVKLKKPVQK